MEKPKKTQDKNQQPSLKDVSFDNIASKFDKSIYGTTKGQLRHEMLIYNLDFVWKYLPQQPRMLDAGGGTGEFTRELLRYSDHVTLNDISADTLDVARDKLNEPSLGDKNLRFHHGPIQSLDIAEKFDFISCHAVFEWLQEPKQVLKHLFNLLNNGGYLSLSFFNQDANLFGNLLYGNFDLINNNMKQKNRLKLATHKPLKPDEVLRWLAKLDCEVCHKAGIRCFHDYLRDKSQQSNDYQQLLAMEKKYCATEPYMWLGKYFHIIVRKL